MKNLEWLRTLDADALAKMFVDSCAMCVFENTECVGKSCNGGIAEWLEHEHEEPDSWERIEADAAMRAVDYYEERIGNPFAEIGVPEIIVKQKLDLVRRCKELAEEKRACTNCADGAFECSECGFFDAYMEGSKVRYCPNCGAKVSSGCQS